jgi:hypothetical protein
MSLPHSHAGTMVSPLDIRATCAEPTIRSPGPYWLDSRTRTFEPPMLVWTIWRMVWFSNEREGAKAVPGCIGEAPHVATQRLPDVSSSACAAAVVKLPINAVIATAICSSERAAKSNLYLTCCSMTRRLL